MLKKLTLVAVAASVIFGSVGVGTVANAAPASASVTKAASLVSVQRIAVIRQHQIDLGKIGIGLRGLSKAKGAQKTALAAQNTKAQAASNAWFSKAYTGKASAAQLRSLRVKASNEIGKFVTLGLAVR